MPDYIPPKKRTEMNSSRSFSNLSRSAKRVAFNLGIISQPGGKVRLYRSDKLEKYDSYYENRQYDGLMDWEAANRASCDGDYVPVRQRKPRLTYNLAKVFSARVAAKLVGKNTFPKLVIEEDPDTEQLIQTIVKMTRLQAKLAEPMRRLTAVGSTFVRFKAMVSDEASAAVHVEHYDSKYCYPVFDSINELVSVRIQYVYCDEADIDEKGAPRKKWYRLDLGRLADTLYDNPEYKESHEPVFQVVESVQHDLGYVQGEWFRTGENQHNPDGPSLLADNLDLIDDINYSISQSSQAISYNQEPQVTIKGLDSEEIEGLIKSSTKAWNLGREGKASFLESELGAVETAIKFRDTIRLAFQDTARITLHDPEKLDGNALSGKAMEILNDPFVELIDEMRPIVEPQLVALVLKITITMLRLMQDGADFGLMIPPEFKIQSLNINVQWPPVFPLTIVDLRDKLNVGLQAANANIISRETVLRWVAKDFGIENIEEELSKVAAQPVINPFGAF
jgi:hypothetical protein